MQSRPIAELTFYLTADLSNSVRNRIEHNYPPTSAPVLHTILDNAIKAAIANGGVWEDKETFIPWHRVQRATISLQERTQQEWDAKRTRDIFRAQERVDEQQRLRNQSKTEPDVY